MLYQLGALSLPAKGLAMLRLKILKASQLAAEDQEFSQDLRSDRAFPSG